MPAVGADSDKPPANRPAEGYRAEARRANHECDGSSDWQARETFFVRWIADTSSPCSGNGNFMRAGISGVRVPIRAATDVVVEVSATGYKSGYFSDPSDPTRPVLRLESGEDKTLNVELVPDVTHSQPTQWAN
jgi:hypothetical protein